LEATFDVTRHGSRGLRVTGQVRAIVEQNCVVTLEPLENTVEENFELVFALDESPMHEENAAADEPEPLVGDVVDLGKIATEFLILGIDPYPRRSGAGFEAPPVDESGAHPFAALAALKKGQGGSDN
jgi:uncharacterized metal-binding protein YceD (DUF177 family)